MLTIDLAAILLTMVIKGVLLIIPITIGVLLGMTLHGMV